MVQKYAVYIMTNVNNNVLYIGMTNNLERRVWEHKNGEGSVFTKKYKCVKLVYYEEFYNVNDAIYREKNLKDYRRSWKLNLIAEENPDMNDLSADW